MRQRMRTGVCALALLATAGCSDVGSWFGGQPDAATAGSTAADGEDAAAGSGTDQGAAAKPLARWGAGMTDDSGARDRAYYPGSLSGRGGLWRGDSDAPGAN